MFSRIILDSNSGFHFSSFCHNMFDISDIFAEYFRGHYITGLSNLNQPRAVHLSTGSKDEPYRAKNKGSFIDFLKNFAYQTSY